MFFQELSCFKRLEAEPEGKKRDMCDEGEEEREKRNMEYNTTTDAYRRKICFFKIDLNKKNLQRRSNHEDELHSKVSQRN